MYNTKLHRVLEQKNEPKERKREELTDVAASFLRYHWQTVEVNFVTTASKMKTESVK